MMDENRLDNIVKCAYNMDNGGPMSRFSTS